MNQDNRRFPDEIRPLDSRANGSRTPDCPLCASEAIDPGDVEHRLLEEFWPEGEHPDHLGLKRALESEHDLSLSVTQVRRHLDEHVVWTWTGGGGR
jgi:hypothetical protein